MRRLIIVLVGVFSLLIAAVVLLRIQRNGAPQTQFCAYMSGSDVGCFPSMAELIDALSGGQITDVPEDLSVSESISTYYAFRMGNLGPGTGSANPSSVNAASGSIQTFAVGIPGPPPSFLSGATSSGLPFGGTQASSPTHTATPDPDDIEGGICTDVFEGIFRCYASVTDFIDQVTFGQMTVVPDDIAFEAAFATYSAFRDDQMRGYEQMQSADQPQGEFCGNLPSGVVRCFPSVADYFYEVSGGRMTPMPQDISHSAAVATYNAWAQSINTPRPYQPTPPPEADMSK